MNEWTGPSCPCGIEADYRSCCEPLHHGQREAGSAEELMRSRYSAHTRGHTDYLLRTWHPRTRPDDVAVDVGITWTGLQVMDVVAGGAEDDCGVVEFTARFESAGRESCRHERSRFERRGRRWFYVDDALTAR
ncbi:YchJ family protein [Mycobacterium sp. URHB0021]